MGCKSLLKAINAYLAKADEDLEKQLEKEKFAEPKKTVEVINSLEEDITNALDTELQEILAKVEKSVDLEKLRDMDLTKADYSDVEIAYAFEDNMRTFLPQLTNTYLQQTDKELYLSQISDKTKAWVNSWGQQLGELMKLSTHNQLTKILNKDLENGVGIAEFTQHIMDSGIRNTRTRARTVAITEVLRSHSVARQESYMQSPVVTHKSWLHSGGLGIDPRDNHVQMSGQIVPKDQPFNLFGKDGGLYQPQYPRDINLPPGESINCHCTHTPIADEKIIGMSLEERRALQQQAIDEMNADTSWREELEAQNRAKAGIEGVSDWDTALQQRYENFRQMTHDEQLEYLGKSKPKQAYVDAGFVTDGRILHEVKNKDFTKLRERGIILVPGSVRNESTIGQYSKLKDPSKPPGKSPNNKKNNGGNPSGGMHGESGLQKMISKGFTYQVNKQYVNGVRVGNINQHVKKLKRENNGQSWFPESWGDDKIHTAGTYVVNVSGVNMQEYTPGTKISGAFENVKVCVVFDNQGGGTIFPDVDQTEMGEWGQVEWENLTRSFLKKLLKAVKRIAE